MEFLDRVSRRLRGRRRTRPVSLSLELVEDRVLMATFTVTNNADIGPGSFRQAIVDSNATSGTDTINFNIRLGAIGQVAIPTGNNVPDSITTTSSVPAVITAGPDGNLWFTEGLGGKIGRLTPAGVLTEFAIPTPQSIPVGIAAGPDGNVWFTESQGNKIGRITPAGVITEFAIPTRDSIPAGIAAGPDGNLWFTESQGNKIGRITPAGVITEYALPEPFSPGGDSSTTTAGPVGITAGPDGNVWFTESLGNKIGRINPSNPDGSIREFAIPASTDQLPTPIAITSGPDGNLWFTESGTNQVSRITPAGAITQFALPKTSLVPSVPSYVTGLPSSFQPVYNAILAPGNTAPAVIKAGPDGNLWFTEAVGNSIARITPAGVITQFLVPTPNSAPGGLTAGPDGNLWFTEGLGNQIGRLNLNNTGLTISPASPLPTISDPAIIDGYTQPGASANTLAIGTNAVLLVEVNGANAGANAAGLTITAGSSTVRGLAINRFGGVGIQVSSSQNLIDGNFLGTDPTGTVARGNTLDGIRLNGASNNRIIGNVASGNGVDQYAAGINLEAGDLSNTIAGNMIGTDASGSKPMGNSLHGVFLGDGSSNNTVSGNVISGNGTLAVDAQTDASDLSAAGGVGVYIYGPNTSSNVVRDNQIGTNLGGSAPLANSIIGVLISLSSGNTVQGNVISGNGLVGLEIAGAAGGAAGGNLVQGNKVGTNLDGTAAIANGRDGIFINDAPNNTIGGATAGAGNLISGNGSVGIQLFGTPTRGNVVEGNGLGLDSSGRPTLPNRAGGIFVNTRPLTNQIGGAAPGQANQGQAGLIPTIQLGGTGAGQANAGLARPQLAATRARQLRAGLKARRSPPSTPRSRLRAGLRNKANY